MNQAECLDALLGEVIDELLAKAALGERPNVDEYAERYPALADFLRQGIPALELLAESGPSQRSTDNAQIFTESVAADRRLGDFRIICQLGRGGMGVVYEAEQLSMGRRVAVKVLPFAALADERMLARFKNEVRAAATLDHPNIVAVYSVGEERGVHYYVMQLIRGQSLADVIAQLRKQSATLAATALGGSEQSSESPLRSADILAETEARPYSSSDAPQRSFTNGAETQPIAALSTDYSIDPKRYFRRVAELGALIAEALQHAHDLGIVHRDIKPANVLVDASGKPYLTDFGLARIATDAGMTMTGDLVGTLRYMSPEQALGNHVTVDHRADIYSLGATLYELLTLQPVFAGENRENVLKQLAFNEPGGLRRLNHRIPAELETILLKALRKDPAERYASAKALASDLRCYLEQKPIVAKPPTLYDRAIKWSRRNERLVLSTGAVSVVAAVALFISGMYLLRAYQAEVGLKAQVTTQFTRASKAEKTARTAQQETTRERDTARRDLYLAHMRVAQQSLNSGRLRHVHDLLEQHIPTKDEADLRGWEWYYLVSQSFDDERMYRGHKCIVGSVSWSPNGEYVAVRSHIKDLHSAIGEVRIYNDKGVCFKEIMCHGQGSLAWNPDGKRLAVTGETSFIWDLASDKLVQLFEGQDPYLHVAWNPDGTRIALSGRGLFSSAMGDTRSIDIWDTTTGEIVRHLLGHEGRVFSMDWSPDGKHLISGDTLGNVRLWDPVTGKQLRSSSPHSSEVAATVFSPRADTLLRGASTGTSRFGVLRTSSAFKLSIPGALSQRTWTGALTPSV